MNTLPRLLLCLLAAALVAWATSGMGHAGIGLALFTLVGALWITQALPLPVTALCVPLLAVLTGLHTPRQALAPFAHPIIFLFLGGFALAAALSAQGLDRALAARVMRLAGGRRLRAVLLLCALTALLSMWMSNTATVAVMLPLALGLLRDEERPLGAREWAFVLLALAYSGSIGGIATLVGSPPNAIAAAQAGLDFAGWLRVGLPMALLLWPLMLGVLALVLRPRLGGQVQADMPELPWTGARMLTLGIFGLTVLGWVLGAPLASALGIAADMDTVVALAAIVALAASGVLHWRDLERQTQWGVLLLFGGGLALSEVMAGSGASTQLAQWLLQAVQNASTLWLLLGLVAFVVFLTELVSNTASAALLLPIFLPLASALGLPPVAVAAAIAVSASCAFMLPVATPPNALVFATEQVPQATMMRCGLWLNLACVATIAGVATVFWV